jgi:hypothetical protein
MAWRLSLGNSIYPGATVRHGYWWPAKSPYTGQLEGSWQGPELALATPQQLRTSSPEVTTANQGFYVDKEGITYTVDVHCEGKSAFGNYEVWVQRQ